VRGLEHAGQRVGVQRLDDGGAVGQHGALVDGSLVGDLAAVDGGRLGQQAQARPCGWRCRWS
jgi:hypothetical protein